MKVVVNLPTTDEGISFLEDSIATFRATLILESIKKLSLENTVSKEILSKVLNKLKETTKESIWL